MSLATDPEALYRACAGDDRARRAEAYQQLGELLHRMLWPRVRSNPRLQPLAADCAQEALVTVWQQLEAGRGPDRPSSFISWAGRIATNKLIDELRKREPRTTTHRSKRVALSQQVRLDTARTEEGRPLAERLPDEATAPPGEDLEYAALRRLLTELHASATISDNSRTVLLRGYLDDWTDDELAEHLSTTRSNVHVIRSRDLSKLRADPEFMARLQAFLEGKDEPGAAEQETDE